MILHDFEKLGFPISKRAPVLCFGTDGKVYVAYNRYSLRLVMQKIEIVKSIGVWPGRKNTDCFVLDPAAYKTTPVPPAENADIDSADDVTVFYGPDDQFLRVAYKEDPIDHSESVCISTKAELLTYIEQAGIKHKVIHEI